MCTDRASHDPWRLESVRTFSTLLVVLALVAAGHAQAPYFSRTDLQLAVDAFEIVDLQGRRWTANDFKGRIVLIDFWATWCAPCLEQIPELQRLRKEYGPDGFEVLAISVNNSTRRDLVAWLNRQEMTWPQAHDGRGFNTRLVREFGVQALPASLLIGPDGKIAAQNVRGDRLVRAVRALLAR